ncbi:hypothetical protein PHAVU_007G145800 [Phaseolus vulgaris]|uniref:UspA domain-containing protein n=1 Tax=Phaseolus vulgaris TaxID=3885 RepID=V7BEP5_PHAVU|nr:hypothetical protein PHAVU_007G145800g [Phaseolus vulgaris]ESW16309.1 hypothetical protein PHAVU_007G145800g [Phaseolus vulgaris]
MAVSQSEKKVVVIGINDREASTYAIRWTLDHFFLSPIFRLVLVHARSIASSTVGFTGPSAGEIFSILDSDFDPRNVLCMVVEKYHSAILVVGNHGHGGFKKFICQEHEQNQMAVLGSVSDFCANHANCTVMIVKKPKIKH